MPTVLFTWELGAGFGHLMPYRAISEILSANGYRVAFAVTDVERAKNVFSGRNITVAQSPVNKFRGNPNEDSFSYAQILSFHGFADFSSLSDWVQDWKK